MLVVAYVRSARRNAVSQALRALAITGWSESQVMGHGHAAEGHGTEHVRFEVVVSSRIAGECARAIAGAAHTGVNGDGMVLTLPVSSLERISDSSRAEAALE